MAIDKATAAQTSSVARAAEGTVDKALRATRDGALFVADWKLAGIMEGRGFMVNVGDFSSPAVGGGAGGTVIDLDAPELVIGVPSGVSILPIRIEVDMSLPVGLADDDEIDILIAVDQDKVNDVDDGTSGTAEAIHNLNTLFANASKCYANSEYSATMTDPVLDLELAHVTKIFELFSTAGSAGALWQGPRLLYEPKTPVIINGPAMVCVYWGGTKAASAFCSAQWLEYPTTFVS